MSILDDFFLTDSIQLDPVSLNVVEPPRFGAIDVIPGGPRTEAVGCVAKAPGSLDATLTVLGLTIPFRGVFLGVDSRGRWLFRWTVDDSTRRRFMITTIERIKGQITASIAPLDPMRTDLMNCSGAPGEFFVAISLVALDDLDDGFRTLPDGTAAENEIRVWAASVTPTRALITAVRGDAGIAAPPPTPWPQPYLVTLNTTCVTSARAMPTVYGHVRLDHPVRRSHAGFGVTVTAEGMDPPRSLDVRVRPPVAGASVVFFEIWLPADFSGDVRVTAVTNDRTRTAVAQFRVGALLVGGSFWLGCEELPEVSYYDAIRVGCEAWDCDWTMINDMAELIGRSGGWAVRYLTTRRAIDPVGRLVGDQAILRAINNQGGVAGVVKDDAGKVNGFIYGEPAAADGGAPELHWAAGVSFHGLNDAMMAVGSLFDGQRTIAVRWHKGAIEELKTPSLDAAALAVNSAGDIAGVHAAKGDGLVRGFLLDEQGFHDLGDLEGNIVGLALNGAGAVAGTVVSGKKVRGFLYLPNTGLFDLKVPQEMTQFALSGINEAGTAVGTFWRAKDGAGRAFRFTMAGGLEDLNVFVSPDRPVTLESAVAINNLGQILALGNENGEPGYFVLNPTAIPTPSLSIP